MPEGLSVLETGAPSALICRLRQLRVVAVSSASIRFPGTRARPMTGGSDTNRQEPLVLRLSSENIMSWIDFELSSALERDLLQRALPLLPTMSDGSSRAIIDLAADSADVAMSVIETLGPTPAGCIELLHLRPLLVGAAWKVVDLLPETALDEAGFQADNARRWTINSKITHATAGDGRPEALNVQVWRALTRMYVETEQLRHSLVHRRAYTDASSALVGTDGSGGQLRPLAAVEQEAFVRSALRAAQLVIATKPDSRVEADLIRQLGALAGVHGQPLPAVALLDSLPEITVVVDPAAGGADGYVLDVPALLRRQPFQGVTHADLVAQFRDRPGQDVRGRLENAPKEIVIIDPDSPPTWLL